MPRFLPGPSTIQKGGCRPVHTQAYVVERHDGELGMKSPMMFVTESNLGVIHFPDLYELACRVASADHCTEMIDAATVLLAKIDGEGN